MYPKAVRDLALALLDDGEGVSEFAYGLLRAMMLEAGDCGDILRAVKSTEGRFYLPEGFTQR